MSDKEGIVEAQRKDRSRSLFGPLALIAAGVFFLLDNLGVIPPVDWSAIARFWPLLLIFLGLNLLVVQLRPPFGTALSLIVSLAAVGVFAYLALVGAPREIAGRDLAGSDVRAYPVSVPLSDANAADIELDLSNYATEITSSTEGDALVSGTIWTTGEPDVRSDMEDGRAVVHIGEEPGMSLINPLEWITNTEDRRWELGLNPDISTNLRLEAGNGRVEADLSGLTLVDLRLDVDNGSTTAFLPSGEYAVDLEGGNGSLRLTLPDDGRQIVTIDGGNGSINLYVPEGVEARIEYEEQNGRISADGRFEQVSGDDEQGVLETAGYRAGQGLEMQVSSGNGSITIAAP